MLLIDNALKDHVPPQLRPGFVQVGHGHECSHQAALHVRGAAAVHQSVHEFSPEGITRPFAFRLDGDRIDVTVQDQGAATPGAAENTDHVWAVVVVQDFLKAAFLERSVCRQFRVREDQIVLPVRRVLGDMGKAFEHRRDVRFHNLRLRAQVPQERRHERLGLSLLPRETREPDKRSKLFGAPLLVFCRKAQRFIQHGYHVRQTKNLLRCKSTSILASLTAAIKHTHRAYCMSARRTRPNKPGFLICIAIFVAS